MIHSTKAKCALNCVLAIRTKFLSGYGGNTKTIRLVRIGKGYAENLNAENTTQNVFLLVNVFFCEPADGKVTPIGIFNKINHSLEEN